MARVTVEVVRVEGGKPRYLTMDDFKGEKDEEIRSGASRIEALRQQARRGELHSVRVLDGSDGAAVAKSDAGRVADLEAEIAQLRAALETAKQPVKRAPKVAAESDQA